MITSELRQAVRHAYNYRCGYCGVREEDVGCELEIDHFRPKSAGGGDELENLVYCCTTCNRHKGKFWPDDPEKASSRILHPLLDDLASHLREEEDGRLIALSKTGRFHIERLKLNRPARIALRLRLRSEARKEATDKATSESERSLREGLLASAERIRQLFDEIDRLSKP
jgi:hypothetical protein